MKKLIFLLILATPLESIAQSATILPNAIAVPVLWPVPECTFSEKGKQVFNSSTNKMYYCNGTVWMEMTGGGFNLPYSATINSAATVLTLENTNTNFGPTILGKSKSGTCIHGMSESAYGLFGQSTSSIAILGSSLTGYGGYFEAFGVNPALYVYGDNGEAAYFDGNVRFKNDIFVANDKGILASNSGAPQKVVRLGMNYSVDSLAAGAYVDKILTYEDFSAPPTILVGQVSTGTGEYYKVQLVPINVTITGCVIRIVNLSSTTINNVSATWQFLIVGNR